MRGASHDPAALIELFDDLFATAENTRLVRGGAEPLYLPPGKSTPHGQVVFAHGFFSSGLHEIAHWCVAGAERRGQVDYGYWYKPDGRTPAEQRAFELAEVRPQALEWIFSVAAGTKFHFSADNLQGGAGGDSPAWRRFQADVREQVATYLARGLPQRAVVFAMALSARFGTRGAWRTLDSYSEARPPQLAEHLLEL